MAADFLCKRICLKGRAAGEWSQSCVFIAHTSFSFLNIRLYVHGVVSHRELIQVQKGWRQLNPCPNGAPPWRYNPRDTQFRARHSAWCVTSFQERRVSLNWKIRIHIKLTSVDFFAESCQIKMLFRTTHAPASGARDTRTSSTVNKSQVPRYGWDSEQRLLSIWTHPARINPRTEQEKPWEPSLRNSISMLDTVYYMQTNILCGVPNWGLQGTWSLRKSDEKQHF